MWTEFGKNEDSRYPVVGSVRVQGVVVPNRRPGVLVLLLCAVLTLGACGGDDKPKKPTKTTASPTPTVPVQPKGANGVTYDIQNWDEIAKDEQKRDVVVVWKAANEAAAASYNKRTLLAPVRELYNAKMRRVYAKALKDGWAKKYTVKATGIVSVRSVDVQGAKATLTACNWKPTTDLYRGKKMVGGLEQSWRKHTATFKKVSNKWIVVNVAEDNDCKGLKAP